MASDQSFVDHVYDQARGVPGLAWKKMFGEYAFFVDGKMIALICDNQLFVKPTPAGRALIGTIDEASPYPGAKPCLRVTDEIDDPTALQRLLQATAEALPMPKPKPARRAKAE